MAVRSGAREEGDQAAASKPAGFGLAMTRCCSPWNPRRAGRADHHLGRASSKHRSINGGCMKFKKLLATAASAALVALALPAAAIADEGGTSLSDGDVLPEVDATIHFSQARYFDLEGAGSNLDVTVPMLATLVDPSGDGVTISENNGEITFTAEDGVPDDWHAVRVHAGFARFTHVGTFDVETSDDAYRAIKIFDAEDRDGEPLFAVVERADLGSDEGW